MLLSRDATQKKLEDPPQGHLLAGEIDGPAISPTPPLSNLNYDWSLKAREITYNNFHSWYLSQISLEIML